MSWDRGRNLGSAIVVVVVVCVLLFAKQFRGLLLKWHRGRVRKTGLVRYWFEIYVLWGGDVTSWLCTNRCWGNMDANWKESIKARPTRRATYWYTHFCSDTGHLEWLRKLQAVYNTRICLHYISDDLLFLLRKSSRFCSKECCTFYVNKIWRVVSTQWQVGSWFFLLVKR